jgi:hypothetical protein
MRRAVFLFEIEVVFQSNGFNFLNFKDNLLHIRQWYAEGMICFYRGQKSDSSAF